MIQSPTLSRDAYRIVVFWWALVPLKSEIVSSAFPFSLRWLHEMCISFVITVLCFIEMFYSRANKPKLEFDGYWYAFWILHMLRLNHGSSAQRIRNNDAVYERHLCPGFPVLTGQGQCPRSLASLLTAIRSHCLAALPTKKSVLNSHMWKNAVSWI